MEIFYSKNVIDSKLFLKKVCSLKNVEIDINNIEKSAHGKPFIRDLPFDFNISHTDGMIACVIGKDVGIDCQEIRQVKDSVITRVCSEDEIKSLNLSQNKTRDFIGLWTFKEAYTKMLGTGFRYPFKNTTIENSIMLNCDIKIYQKVIDNIYLTAIERVGYSVEITEFGV